jgi:hypothetical protein
VGQASHRSRRDVAEALGFNASYRMRVIGSARRYALATRRSIKLTVMLFPNFAACLSQHLNLI